MGNSNEFIFIKSPQVNKNEIIPYLSPNFKVLLGPVNKSTLNMHAGKTAEAVEDPVISFRNKCC